LIYSTFYSSTIHSISRQKDQPILPDKPVDYRNKGIYYLPAPVSIQLADLPLSPAFPVHPISLMHNVPVTVINDKRTDRIVSAMSSQNIPPQVPIHKKSIPVAWIVLGIILFLAVFSLCDKSDSQSLDTQIHHISSIECSVFP